MKHLITLVLLIVISACSPQTSESDKLHFLGSDVSEEHIGGPFELPAHTGQTVKLSDFQGKVVVLVFGYAHCPDICPTNLLDYSRAIESLGNQSQDVQLLFISVDPERDTPKVLSDYTPIFNEHFIGLSAQNETQLSPILKAYKIMAQKHYTEEGNYSVDHSAGSYLIDRKGFVRVYEPHAVPFKQLAQDIETLLKSGQ